MEQGLDWDIARWCAEHLASLSPDTRFYMGIEVGLVASVFIGFVLWIKYIRHVNRFNRDKLLIRSEFPFTKESASDQAAAILALIERRRKATRKGFHYNEDLYDLMLQTDSAKVMGNALRWLIRVLHNYGCYIIVRQYDDLEGLSQEEFDELCKEVRDERILHKMRMQWDYDYRNRIEKEKSYDKKTWIDRLFSMTFCITLALVVVGVSFNRRVVQPFNNSQFMTEMRETIKFFSHLLS